MSLPLPLPYSRAVTVAHIQRFPAAPSSQPQPPLAERLARGRAFQQALVARDLGLDRLTRPYAITVKRKGEVIEYISLDWMSQAVRDGAAEYCPECEGTGYALVQGGPGQESYYGWAPDEWYVPCRCEQGLIWRDDAYTSRFYEEEAEEAGSEEPLPF